MPVFKVNVKWNSQRLSDVEVNTDSSPQEFKALLFSLTGVPPDRQKVMMPGGLLGNSSFDKIKLRNGASIMLMGSAEEIPENLLSLSNIDPVKEIKQTEQSKDMPCGIVNLGNTCYMNGSLQLLFSIPEIKAIIQSLSMPSTVGIESDCRYLLLSLKSVFHLMERSDQPVLPHLFLASLHTACPQFTTLATQGSGIATGLDPSLAALAAAGGMPTLQQQDANECWTEIVRILQKVVVNPAFAETLPTRFGSFGATSDWNPVDRYLTGHMSSILTCTEGEEPPQESVDTFSQLSCFIDKDVKYLHTGIRQGLKGTLTKTSSVLGREAVYKKISQFSRLPGYLCVQFVRFYFKERERVNAKILKDIKFPISLDLYEFCSTDLQTKLAPQREKVRLEEEAEAMAIKSRKTEKPEEPPNPMDNPELYDPYWMPDDLGSNNSGFYELQGVLTHQGRSSSSGHYVAWVKKKGKWFKMDDDKVFEVTPEDIMKVSGGGDWHCAYLLLYGPRRVKKTSPPAQGENHTDTAQAMDVSANASGK